MSKTTFEVGEGFNLTVPSVRIYINHIFSASSVSVIQEVGMVCQIIFK